MASSTSDNSIWYLYGVVPAEAANSAIGGAPAGLDDSAVVVEAADGAAVLLSKLDRSAYDDDAMEANSGDLEWLGPRAVAHDLVLTWATDRFDGAVVPFPMFSLFSGGDAMRAMLASRRSELAEAFRRVREGREYALRVYRVDRELLDAVTTLSPRLGDLAAQAAAASPGQRYLLERKLENEKRGELRVVSQEVVDRVVSGLAANAVAHARSPIPRTSDADAAARGTMLLNAAFLIAPASLDAFQRTLTALVERHGSHGFRFDFTGPWPPYHFVSAGGDHGD